MDIGIVGVGVVGSAVKFGMEKLGHNVRCYDIKLEGTKIEDVINSEIIFLCLPTPSNEDGSCNTTIVENVVEEIYNAWQKLPYPVTPNHIKLPKNHLIVAIKSTVSPGTTRKLHNKYCSKEFEFAFVPEFLRERCAITDFTENHDVCIIGTLTTSHLGVYEKLKEAHGKFPKAFVNLIFEEAEMVKLYNNAFNACRITFANAFYGVCKKHGINYAKVKNAVTHIRHIPDFYLDVNENFRGFGGMCLPKDMKSLVRLSEGTDVDFFKDILKENSKYKVTVLPGMRG